MAEWQEGWVELDGARMHYYRGGSPGKPGMVLAHGFSDMGLCWESLAGELAAEYDILMPDARGHGLSARVQPGELTDMPADLAGIMRALGFERAVVAGHSMGGMVVGQLAARFPELVGTLILEDPAWFLPEFEGEHGGIGEGPMAEWVRSLAVRGAEELMAECRAEHPNWSESVVRRWCEGKKQLDQNFLAIRDRAWSRWSVAVKAIRCPALLVTADPALGGLISPEMAQKIVTMNPLFQVAHIPGVGHHVRFGAEAEYTRVVRSFLGK
jgi:pimeloyl-ACP methyl ester carboxylesterase